MRATIVAGLASVALLVALAPGAAAGTHALTCPAAWQSGWVRLADKVQAPVYCPTWMPSPLDAHIGGQWQDIYSISKDHSYLVSFLEHGDLGSGDVHVNFRGYPGRMTIPRCGWPRERQWDSRDRLPDELGSRSVACLARVAPQRVALHG